jgi:hypothetical protein
MTGTDELNSIYILLVVVAISLGKYRLGVRFSFVHIVASFLFPFFSAFYFAMLV